MGQLVRCICPGCKHHLHIPAEWMHHPLRCKHCGLIVQAKQPTPAAHRAASPPSPPPLPTHRTPPPAPKPPVQATPKPPISKPPVPPPAARPAAPSNAIVTPTAKAQPAPVARLVSTPTAITPAVPVAKAASASPFAGIEGGEQDSVLSKPQRRRRNRGWWKGPALVFSFLTIAGVVAFAFREPILDVFKTPSSEESKVAKADTKKEPHEAPSALIIDYKWKDSPTHKAPVRERPKKSDPPVKRDPPKKHNPPKSKPVKKPTKPKSSPRPKPKSNPNPPPKTKPTPQPRPRRPANNPYPRRALVVSVHDYLYANPIQNGPPTPPSAHNFNTLIESLNRGLNIPLNQIAHLSDDATKKWGARAPTKKVITETVANFLNSSRPQDRIMLFFVGHSTELGDEVYLAPIEGELDKADTLIPLKWFYEQLSQCKARQKVLVLDINRYNRTFGQERPGGEEMGEKLDALLKAPPAGIQVWSSCIAKQRSFASDDYPIGVFFDSMMTAFNQGLSDTEQKPEDPLPVQPYVARINEIMKADLSKRKLEQVSRLSGKEAVSKLNYDADAAPSPDAIASLASAPADVVVNQALLEALTRQIGTPQVKVTHELGMRYDALPPFSVDALKKYQNDAPNPDSPLRKAVKDARVVLWAIYPGQPPEKLSKDVAKRRESIRFQLNVLKDGYRAPKGAGNAEKNFKAMVENDERRVALILSAIDETLEELQNEDVTAARKKESLRWKANYDLILARVLLERAYLFEYQSMLGSMRKEFPPRDANLQGGWKLASQARLQGDSNGKKSAKKAVKLLEKIATENAGTPWEILAKREKLTNLGLEWQAVK